MQLVQNSGISISSYVLHALVDVYDNSFDVAELPMSVRQTTL